MISRFCFFNIWLSDFLGQVGNQVALTSVLYFYFQWDRLSGSFDISCIFLFPAFKCRGDRSSQWTSVSPTRPTPRDSFTPPPSVPRATSVIQRIEGMNSQSTLSGKALLIGHKTCWHGYYYLDKLTWSLYLFGIPLISSFWPLKGRIKSSLFMLHIGV